MTQGMLDQLARLCTAPFQGDWKKFLDPLLPELRQHFIFDNLAVYRSDASANSVEAVYARATGRGRSKEADASWGEEIASQVLSSGRVILTNPAEDEKDDRTKMPHLLGIPLVYYGGKGVLVFVRFGGPPYTPDGFSWAFLAASLVTRGFQQQAWQGAVDQLENAHRLARLQDDFIATISHELNTPLGFIKGYTTSLLRAEANWDAATQKEFLTIIDEETDQLVVLIEKMLESAQLQSGTFTLEFQPVRLEALIHDVVLRMQARHKGLEVDLQLQPAEPIQGDAVRLGQVFTNLFDNAIKYAPGALVSLHLEVHKESQVITFSDQGPGIPPDHLPYLFDRFYRVPDMQHKRGAGLGLFICKQIVQAHRGHITLKTVPGKSTTFRIELPAGQSKGI